MDPPLAEVYGIMAEVWSHSEEAPTPEDLAQLTAGVSQFPGIAPLVSRCIYLNVAQDRTEAAAELARRGILAARDQETRQRFERILAQLAQLRPNQPRHEDAGLERSTGSP